jgi:hypothetical protein
MNTLAYFASMSAVKEKSFITLAPGGQNSNMYLNGVHNFNASVNKASVIS